VGSPVPGVAAKGAGPRDGWQMSPEDARLAREEFMRAESGDVPGWWRRVFRDNDNSGGSDADESDGLDSQESLWNDDASISRGQLPQLTLEVLRQIVSECVLSLLPEAGGHREAVNEAFERRVEGVQFRFRISSAERQDWTRRKQRAFAVIARSQGAVAPSRIGKLNVALAGHVERLQATEKELQRRISEERKALSADEALLAHNGPMVVRVAAARSRLRRTLGMVPAVANVLEGSEFDTPGAVACIPSKSEAGSSSEKDSAAPEAATPLPAAAAEATNTDLVDSNRRPKRVRRSTASDREWNPAKAREEDMQKSQKLQEERADEARRRRERRKGTLDAGTLPSGPEQLSLPPLMSPPPALPKDAELATLGSLRDRVAVGIRVHRERSK